MSRRKQSNPKPLLKSECQDIADEMTVETDSKDFCDNKIVDEATATAATALDYDIPQSFATSERLCDEKSSPSPKSPLALSNTVDSSTRTSAVRSGKRRRSTSSSSLSPPIMLRSSTSCSSSSPTSTTSPKPIINSNAEVRAVNFSKAGEDQLAQSKIKPDSTAVPKLRLNALLASDPALKPEAKDIKKFQAAVEALAGVADTFNQKIGADDDDDDDGDGGGDGGGGSITINTTLANISAAVTHTHNQLKSPIVEVTPRMHVFMCHPCGIRFSSLSTLEAHQTYYCSHRKDNEDEANTSNVSTTELHQTSTAAGEPSTKSVKTGKQYACTQCSYSADKKVSLNRHMRMHQSSPAPSSNASNGDDSSSQQQQVDRYCSDCDIRFSNIKTYRAHKQHYCSSRRTEIQQNSTPKSDLKKSGSASPQERSKTPTLVAPPQPYLALPTNPMLIIPYSLIRVASLLPGPLTSLTAGIANPDTTCFSFENGALHPLATVLTTQSLTDAAPISNTSRTQPTTNNNLTPASSQAPTPTSTSTPKPAMLTEKNVRTLSQPEIQKTIKKDAPSSRESAPLDLTVRKSPVGKSRQRSDSFSPSTADDNRIDLDAIMEGKENLSISSGKITPEQIVCAPSLPSSPSLTPSPHRRRTNSPKSSSVSVSPGPNLSGPVAMRPLLPSELALKLTESNIIAPLLSKQNIEMALKLNSSANKLTAENSPNPVNNATNPLISLPTTPINMVPPIPNVQPQIYVKQGVSKCKECNIVFCKFENFLAHKQHYCSARNQEDTESKIPTPPVAGNTADASGPTQMAYQQLICAACGIKYTSLDNLRAHQKFYCPKGGDLASQPQAQVQVQAQTQPQVQIVIGKEKCGKCKLIHEIGHQCPVSGSGNSQITYKCPVCDVVSLNASDSRKHLETHGSVKAFRCTICRYKGNTLRGMRTHIRMHFDKKTSDFNEENYMSCILEEDGVEISNTPAQAHLGSPAASAISANIHPSTLPNQEQRGQQQLYNCEMCNYSSSYKGNVMRHMKLVHSQQSTPPSTSPDIGEGGESLVQNGESDVKKSDDKIIIKVEPVDIKDPADSDYSTEVDEQINVKIEVDDRIDNNNMQDIILSTKLQSLPKIQQHKLAVQAAQQQILLSTTPTVVTSIPVGITTPQGQLQQPLSCTSPITSEDNSIKSHGPKYCQTCDIKFKFTNSYIAHKQFYCKSSRVVAAANSVNVVERASLSPVQSPVILVTKNKENLETVL